MEQLQKFHKTWKYHDKLDIKQLEYASRIAEIKKADYYHGGDVLYELHNVPGVWHEQCLSSADE